MRLKPLLKWAGGKSWLVPHLKPIWDNYSEYRLVEPFCGGLGITLGLAPTRALLNDINPHLINLYNWVKTGLHITIDMQNNSEMFYEYREKFNYIIEQSINDKLAAELFYYLNRTCFNGLCRFNRKGKFNVPFGKYKTINYADDFLVYVDLFKNFTFSAGDFENVVPKPDDFLFIDPPYDVQFTSYAQEDFTWTDQERLIRWLSKFDNPIVISNQATPRILSLYQDYGFDVDTQLDAPRRISSSGDRTPAKEVIATKNIRMPQMLI